MSTTIFRYGYPVAPPRDTGPLKALVAKRKVACWDEFPPATKAVYLSIARCYPGVQLHACGSRVKGYYCDLNDFEADHARTLIGHRRKVSDYDFIAPAGALPVCPLPACADQANNTPDGRSSIPIPIYRITQPPPDGNNAQPGTSAIP